MLNKFEKKIVRRFEVPTQVYRHFPCCLQTNKLPSISINTEFQIFFQTKVRKRER